MNTRSQNRLRLIRAKLLILSFSLALNLPAGETNTMKQAIQVSLANVFNLDGIFPDNETFYDGLDGSGYACSSNLLGTVQIWNGVKFNIGSTHDNVVSCEGQVVNLPAGTFSRLEILATAVNGAKASQEFTVIYADTNFDQTIIQNMSDWCDPGGYNGESRAVPMHYRNQSDGTRNTQLLYLYSYSFNLNPSNIVKAVKLPDDDDVKVFAMTLVR